MLHLSIFLFFFFNDTATTEIYTLSLHDALPIFVHAIGCAEIQILRQACGRGVLRILFIQVLRGDRKSTRLNSSHQIISYAVFCLKKKKKTVIKTLATQIVVAVSCVADLAVTRVI